MLGVLLQFAPPAVRPLAAVLHVAAFAVLFVVVTWYRDDDALAAGVLLAVTTGLATLAGRVVAEVRRVQVPGARR